MYNKLFTKILDSSIWLAPDPHRLVWITFLAAMDEDGNAMFASAKNVAARARVTDAQAEAAIVAFENPDPDSGDPENEGRRLERFPGGWLILNAHKYRGLITKAMQRENNRQRVAEWRANQKLVTNVTNVTNVTKSNKVSRISEAEAEADTKAGRKEKNSMSVSPTVLEVFEHWKVTHNHPESRLDAKRQKLIVAALKTYSVATLCQSVSGYLNSPHHMGVNERNTKYDDIELFLRDAKHIDAGLTFYQQPPRTELSSLTRKNVATTQDWTPPEVRHARK